MKINHHRLQLVSLVIKVLADEVQASGCWKLKMKHFLAAK
uniref:Uncharacterized protein n=1 Tax=Arundo donax TaxID=35708 RepID=A0A0A9AKF6_ARUDO